MYFGASLPALTDLANSLGYALVGCNSFGSNAFYVRRDLLNGKVQEKSGKESYVESKFRESRDKLGHLSLISGKDRYEVIKGMNVINTETGDVELL